MDDCTPSVRVVRLPSVHNLNVAVTTSYDVQSKMHQLDTTRQSRATPRRCKTGDYVQGEPKCMAYIFKTPQTVFMIVGILQRHFILDASVDSMFIKFIIKVAPPGEIIT